MICKELYIYVLVFKTGVACWLILLVDYFLLPVRNCQEIRLRNVHQIDAGIGQVVAVDRTRRVFHLHGSNWYTLNSYMMHVTVGPAGIWGVDRQQYINKMVAGKWTRTGSKTI